MLSNLNYFYQILSIIDSSEHLEERELVDSWLDTLQRATNDDEKFTLYKILVEFFEDRGHFWNMAGYAQKQFDLVRNSVNKEHLLCGSLNLARAKLFLGDHSEAAKMANYVSTRTRFATLATLFSESQHAREY